MFIQWTTRKNVLCLSEKVAQELNINSEKLTVHFGALKKEMPVQIQNTLPSNTIGLPRDFFVTYTIPNNLPYEIICNGQNLIIGPVIAFIPTRSKRRLRAMDLRKYNRRMAHYSNIKGLVILCASDGIDTEAKTIDGYCYNPDGKDNKSKWVHGTFPFPQAVYKKKNMNPSLYHKLRAVIGDRIFNSYHFNKQEFWNYFAYDPRTRVHIPYTQKYQGLTQLKKMVGQYGTVYLKPVVGSHGRGVIAVQKAANRSYKFTNHNRKVVVLREESKIRSYLSKSISRNYLIQQGTAHKYQNRNVDFRAYLQKNGENQWVVQGMIGRFSKKGSIITNLRSSQEFYNGIEAIQILFKVNKQRAERIYENARRACIQVCERIDRQAGVFGDVAIDLTIDQFQKVWVLEINKAYTYNMVRILKDADLYDRLMTTPFEYAKWLAGFRK